MPTLIHRLTNWGLKIRETRLVVGHPVRLFAMIKLTVKRLSFRNTDTGCDCWVFLILLAQISFCMLRLALNKLVPILIGYSQWLKLNFEAERTDFNHHWHCLVPSCLEALKWPMRAAVLYYIYNRGTDSEFDSQSQVSWYVLVFSSIPVP